MELTRYSDSLASLLLGIGNKRFAPMTNVIILVIFGINHCVNAGMLDKTRQCGKTGIRPSFKSIDGDDFDDFIVINLSDRKRFALFCLFFWMWILDLELFFVFA